MLLGVCVCVEKDASKIRKPFQNIEKRCTADLSKLNFLQSRPILLGGVRTYLGSFSLKLYCEDVEFFTSYTYPEVCCSGRSFTLRFLEFKNFVRCYGADIAKPVPGLVKV